MTETTSTHCDRTGWGEGPWDGEPDKVNWIDLQTDLDCMIVRNHWGSLCGYVAVCKGHPWYGLHYSDVDAEVHGGLSYSDKCQETDVPGEAGLVCHVPEPGRPHDVWWLGFDCGHAFDLAPGMQAYERDLAAKDPRYAEIGERILLLTYKDIDYVRGEVKTLANQVWAAA